MLKKAITVSALLAWLLLFAGCGQTGPLYLPRPKPATPAAGTVVPSAHGQTGQLQKKTSS